MAKLKRNDLKVKLKTVLQTDREADVKALGLKTYGLFWDLVKVLMRSGKSRLQAVTKAHQHLTYNINIKEL